MHADAPGYLTRLRLRNHNVMCDAEKVVPEYTPRRSNA